MNKVNYMDKFKLNKVKLGNTFYMYIWTKVG